MTTRRPRLDTTEEQDALIEAILPGYLTAANVKDALEVVDDGLRALMDDGKLKGIPVCGTVVFEPQQVGNLLRKWERVKSPA